MPEATSLPIVTEQQAQLHPQAEVEVPPPTANEFGRVIFNAPKGPITKEIVKNLSSNRNINLVAGKEALPEKVIEDVVDSIFGGEKPKGKNLAETYEKLNDRLNAVRELGAKRYDQLTAPQQRVLRAALEMRIRRTTGLGPLFQNLIDKGMNKDNMLDKLLQRGSMQEILNGKLADALVIMEEGTNLLALRDEVSRLEQRQKQVKAKLDALPKTVTKTSPDVQSAKVQSLEEETARLQDRLDSLPDEISNIEDRLELREQTLLGAGWNQVAIDAEPRVRQYNKQINKLNTEKGKLKTQLSDLKSKLTKERNAGETSNAYTTFLAEYEEISRQLSEKRGLEATARVHALKKANELYHKLVDILPESSKEFIEELKTEVIEANKERVIDENKIKAEDAKKKGDIFTQAQAEMTEAITRRYTEQYRNAGFLGLRASDRFRPRMDLLQGEFNMLMTQGSTGLTQYILSHNSGLSTETRNYLNSNPEVKKEFIQKMKLEVYKNVAREGVRFLKLDEGSIRSLAATEEFITATQQAIATNKNVRDVIQNIAQGDLNDKGTVRRLWERLPFGGLFGIIALIFGLAGGGLFGVGKKVL